MKTLGHPLHPLLVHFPTALLPMDLALSVWAHAKHDEALALAGFYCLAGGVLTGLLTAVTGLLDILSVRKPPKAVIETALYHGFLNGSILLVFAGIAWRAWQSYPQGTVPGPGLLILKGVLVLLIFFGNYLGGKLIYKYHLGIAAKQP